MKTAICLFGKHYTADKIRDPYLVDYRYSLINYKDYIFSFFDNSYGDMINTNNINMNNGNIDVFISTYNSEIIDNLLIDFQPIKYKIVLEGNHGVSGGKGPRNIHCFNVLNLVKEYSQDNRIIYNNIVLLRFDLYFYKHLSNFNINLEKFNISYFTEQNNDIDDNFYIFPYKYIDLMISLNDKDIFAHSIFSMKDGLKDKILLDNINFITEDRCLTYNNKIYQFIRYALNSKERKKYLFFHDRHYS